MTSRRGGIPQRYNNHRLGYVDALRVRVKALDMHDKARSFSIFIDPHCTFIELKEAIALGLDSVHQSNIHIIHNKGLLEMDNDMTIPTFNDDDLLVVHYGNPDMRKTLLSPLTACWDGDDTTMYTDDDPMYNRDIELALAKSKEMIAVQSFLEIPGKSPSSSLPYREIPEYQSVSGKNFPLALRPSSGWDFGHSIVRGTISQYTLGGFSACTHICLVVAKWLLNNDHASEGSLSPELLDAFVEEGVLHMGGHQQHACLDDIWGSSTYAEGLERGLPIQNMTSVPNYLCALEQSWQYALESGQERLAVVFTKAPETILCFAAARPMDHPPHWFLFDSHGETNAHDKVAYIIRFDSAHHLAEALGVKYPPIEGLDTEQHYTMQMLCQFEATPIVVSPKSSNLEGLKSPLSLVEVGKQDRALLSCSTSEDSISLSKAETVVASICENDDTPKKFEQTTQSTSTGIKGEGNERTNDISNNTYTPGYKFIRIPEEAEAKDDLLIAVDLCSQADMVDLKYAIDRASGNIRCMVTCCAIVTTAELARSCRRCGRLVCPACCRFAVSSTNQFSDARALVCLECAFELVGAVDLLCREEEKIKANLMKCVLQPRYTEIYKHAKDLLVAREEFKAARKHHNAIIEISKQIEALQREKNVLTGVLLSEITEEDGEFIEEDGEFTEVSAGSILVGERRLPDPPQFSENTLTPASLSAKKSQSSLVTDTFDDWIEAFRMAGRDEWPLPFGLKYPTPFMKEKCSQLVTDLENWANTRQTDFEAALVAKREFLQEQRAGLKVQVAELRAKTKRYPDAVEIVRERTYGRGTMNTNVSSGASFREPRLNSSHKSPTVLQGPDPRPYIHDAFNEYKEHCPQCRLRGPFSIQRGFVCCTNCDWSHQLSAW